jgi:general stress protein YciG
VTLNNTEGGLIMPTEKKPMTGSGKQPEPGQKKGGSGNFSADREKASEAGKKGGEHSHTGGRK